MTLADTAREVSTRHDAGPVFEAVAGFLRAVILPNRVKAGSILETGIDIGIAARQIGRAGILVKRGFSNTRGLSSELKG